MTARYRRIPLSEESELNGEEIKKRRAENVERITAKLHALFWVAIAAVVLYYSDILQVGIHDQRVKRSVIFCTSFFIHVIFFPLRPYLNIAVACLVANICIMIYLTIWLPLVLKVTISWDIYCPRMIPTSTLLGILCLLFLVVAFWPVWGLLTPLIIIILFMGLLFSTHFIPWPC